MAIADPIAATSSASADHADMRLVGLGQLLGQAALQAERRQLRREFDDQHRIGEAAELLPRRRCGRR